GAAPRGYGANAPSFPPPPEERAPLNEAASRRRSRGERAPVKLGALCRRSRKCSFHDRYLLLFTVLALSRLSPALVWRTRHRARSACRRVGHILRRTVTLAPHPASANRLIQPAAPRLSSVKARYR